MLAASACAVSSPAAASGTCRPPPTTCASYTGRLSAAPDQPQRGTPTATGPSSKPPEARQGRLLAMLNRFKRQRPAIQQQALQHKPITAVSDLADMLWNQGFRLHPQNSLKPLITLNFGLESDTAVLS